MAKIWSLAFALLVGAGVWAAPAMAQSNDVDDVGTIERVGGEASTRLSGAGLAYESADFSMRVSNELQFRFTHQQEVANGEDGTNGRNFNNFRLPLARTTFSGHIYNEDFQYRLRLAWNQGGGAILEVGTFRWALMQYLNVNAGQDKVDFSWEYNTNLTTMTFTERSYVNQVFNQNYGKGVWIDGVVGDDVPFLMYSFGIYNGVLRSNTDFRNADVGINAERFADGVVDGDLMINARVESHFLGAMDRRMNDNRSADANDKMLVAVGMSINYLQAGFNEQNIRPDTAGAGTTSSGRFRTRADTWAVSLDAHWRWMGLSADLEFYYRHTDFRNLGSNDFNPGRPSRSGISNLTDMGIALEVGYFIIPEELNVGVRFNVLTPDKTWEAAGNSTDGSKEHGVWSETIEIGVAVNYYIHGDHLRLTMDINHVSQRQPSAYGAGTPINGIYNNPPGRGASSSSDFNNLWIIRLQLQWQF
jgi:hypothetical protein